MAQIVVIDAAFRGVLPPPFTTLPEWVVPSGDPGEVTYHIEVKEGDPERNVVKAREFYEFIQDSPGIMYNMYVTSSELEVGLAAVRAAMPHVIPDTIVMLEHLARKLYSSRQRAFIFGG